jgi:elongation factor Ts
MLEDVKKLRDETGAGVMDVQRALKEAGGDFDKAKNIIREKGMLIASKKSERKTGAGLLGSYIHNNKVGVLLELRCETDFVARSEPLQKLAHEITMHIAAMSPEDVEELLDQSYIRDESQTIDQLVKEVIAKTGENIIVERFCRYEL